MSGVKPFDEPRLAPWPARALVKVAPAEPALHAYLKNLLERVGASAAALCLEARAHVEEAVRLCLDALRDSTWDFMLSLEAHREHVSTSRNSAAEALLEHARPGDVLLEDLKSIDAGNDAVLDAQIAAVIMRLFPGNVNALRRVEQGLHHEKDRVRERTAWTLPHIICADARVVPLALEALGSPLEGVRTASIYALSKIEKTPLEVLPVLTDHLRRGSAYQRDTLLKLIGSLGPEAASAAKAVLEVLDSSEEDHWCRGVVTLARIHATHVGCVPHYIRGLEEEDARIRMWALLGLQVMGSAATPSLPAIKKVLADPSSDVRIRAVMAMAMVGQEHPETKVSLAKIAGADPEESVRKMAAYALGWLPSP